MTRRQRPAWNWRTFPVLVAFVAGGLLASLIDPPNSDFAVGVRILLLVAAAYCAAHMVVIFVIRPSRSRGNGASAASLDDDDESEYEDELVLPSRPSSD